MMSHEVFARDAVNGWHEDRRINSPKGRLNLNSRSRTSRRLDGRRVGGAGGREKRGDITEIIGAPIPNRSVWMWLVVTHIIGGGA